MMNLVLFMIQNECFTDSKSKKLLKKVKYDRFLVPRVILESLCSSLLVPSNEMRQDLINNSPF